MLEGGGGVITRDAEVTSSDVWSFQGKGDDYLLEHCFSGRLRWRSLVSGQDQIQGSEHFVSVS